MVELTTSAAAGESEPFGSVAADPPELMVAAGPTHAPAMSAARNPASVAVRSLLAQLWVILLLARLWILETILWRSAMRSLGRAGAYVDDDEARSLPAAARGFRTEAGPLVSQLSSLRAAGSGWKYPLVILERVSIGRRLNRLYERIAATLIAATPEFLSEDPEIRRTMLQVQGLAQRIAALREEVVIIRSHSAPDSSDAIASPGPVPGHRKQRWKLLWSSIAVAVVAGVVWLSIQGKSPNPAVEVSGSAKNLVEDALLVENDTRGGYSRFKVQVTAKGSELRPLLPFLILQHVDTTGAIFDSSPLRLQGAIIQPGEKGIYESSAFAPRGERKLAKLSIVLGN